MIPALGSDASARPASGTLSLAGLSVFMDGPLCPSFTSWPASYHPFLSADSGLAADAHFHVGAPERHPVEERFVLGYEAGAWQFGTVDGRGVYRFHAGTNPTYLWAEPNEDFSRVDVWPEKEFGRKMPPLLHPVDRVLCMGVLVHRDRIIVHSCGWSYQGKSLLFPGVSGAGKTTLCNQLMAAGRGNILSDDRVILHEGAAGFQACGTPWPGDAKQARNESAPLAALCFIEKASEHRLTPIRPAEAFRRFVETASVPWFSPAMRDRSLPLVERLVLTVPAYRLDFRPEPGVMECLLPLVESAG